MSIPRVIKNIVRAVCLTDKDGAAVTSLNPLPVSGSFSVTASPAVTTGSDGELLKMDDLAQVLSYTGTVLNYIEVVQSGKTYRQTLTYTGANLTGVSAWVKQ